MTRSVAAAIAALAENNSEAKDLFVQLGFAQKICDRILFANNNSLARSMMVTLGQIVEKHEASLKNACERLLEVKGHEPLSCMDVVSAKLSDADTGVKKAALNTFLNLILDSEENIKESQACRLLETSRDFNHVAEYALQALSMVLCK